MRLGGYICRSSSTGRRLSWSDWLRFSSLLGNLPDLHGGLHLADSGVSLLDSSCLSINGFLCTQVIGLLLGWGTLFGLRFENDPPWMQVGLLSSWTMSIRRS